MNYINDPQAIEKESFRIISEELGDKLPDEDIRDIVLRVIHTTADFEYADLIEFKNNPVERGLKALSEGAEIYADTAMIRKAVNSRALAMQGCEIVNYVHDQDVREAAAEQGITRSAAAMKKALAGDKVRIFAIGNAPTALYTLIEGIEAGMPAPDLIIGAPIGFVGAAESKAALDRLDAMDVPYIRINGRKGGSPVAAAILNAMLYRLGREW
ncbi:MAG: precorrin-8X methylmutase [Eubacteriaceae bacterium]